ncbi:syntaxin-like isoform X2 [Coccinella septempunctata]|uniref:syntaxin-like isoform X2 n=1 Tax=Coccinella septempunctata TaxID=41139 RepID=UPI001D07B977|nr:syntaxin-like isoform X2 [Coccinella septempunctata]
MVRDRLEEFKRARESENSYERLDSTIVIEENRLRNIFELSEEIGQGIENIRENVETCDHYMKQIFESPYMEKELSDKLTEIFQQNGKLTRIITSKLKQFEDHVKNTNKTCTVGRIEMIQYNTLRTRFREYLKKNNDQMENLRTYRINNYKTQLRVKGVEVADEEFTELLNGSQQQLFNDNVLIETAEAKRLLTEAEELNVQLQKIESLIIEIRDLFVQMSVLVEDQQELIDVVEYQTQKAVEYIYKTPILLREAEDKKRKAFKMKFMCFGIIAIVIVILVLSFIYN